MFPQANIIAEKQFGTVNDIIMELGIIKEHGDGARDILDRRLDVLVEDGIIEVSLDESGNKEGILRIVLHRVDLLDELQVNRARILL